MQRIGWLAGNRRRFRHASPIAFDPRRTIDIFDGQFAWLPFRFSVGKRTGTAELSDPGTPAMVDTATRRLVARPRLVLSTTANQLAGDGQDSADIAIALVNEHGAHVEGAAGAVKVTTERGKLSARGGLVNLVDGRASIILTSTNETVSHVRVTAAPVDRVYASAFLDLEFV